MLSGATTISNTNPFDPKVLTVDRIKSAIRLIEGISPGGVFGVRVFYSALCEQPSKEPNRIYDPRRAKSFRKAALIQKKWLKRWGVKMKPAIFKTPNGYFAHPTFKKHFEEALMREKIIQDRLNEPLNRWIVP